MITSCPRWLRMSFLPTPSFLFTIAVFTLACAMLPATPASAATGGTPPTPTLFGLAANGDTATRNAEKSLGVTAGVYGTFRDFTGKFPTKEAQNASRRGAVLMISWEPWNARKGYLTQPAYSLANIAAGKFDGYIRQFAKDAAAVKRPVFIRFAAEMNGDWNVWSVNSFGNTPHDYINAHRRIVSISDGVGATNIRWVFNPIVSYEGSVPLATIYPGDDVVDWVALDGYNWGSLKWGWQSFSDIFTAGLTELSAVAPTKPLAIAEIGSTPGTNKAVWVTDALTTARQSGAVMVVWFEHLKETDWRVSSDPAVASATKTVVTSPGWVTGGNATIVDEAIRNAEKSHS